MGTMKTFRIEAMSTVGEEIERIIIADSQERAESKMRSEGYFVTKVRELTEKDDALDTDDNNYNAIDRVRDWCCSFLRLLLNKLENTNEA